MTVSLDEFECRWFAMHRLIHEVEDKDLRFDMQVLLNQLETAHGQCMANQGVDWFRDWLKYNMPNLPPCDAEAYLNDFINDSAWGVSNMCYDYQPRDKRVGGSVGMVSIPAMGMEPHFNVNELEEPNDD